MPVTGTTAFPLTAEVHFWKKISRGTSCIKRPTPPNRLGGKELSFHHRDNNMEKTRSKQQRQTFHFMKEATRRERWLLISLFLLTTTNTTTRMGVIVEATPFAQHRIPATRRHVPYKSRLGEVIVVQQQQQQHHYDDNDHVTVKGGEKLWHVLADASKEHPDPVYRKLREQGTSHSRSSSSSSSSSSPTSSNSRLRRQRTLQQDHQQEPYPTMDDDTLFEEEEDNILSSDTVDNILKNHSKEFNVTTETEYDVDSNTNDTSTVIYTQSEPQNSTQSDNNSTETNPTNTDNTNSNSSATNANKNSTNSTNTTSTTNTTTTDDLLSNYNPIRIRAFLADVAGGGEHLTEHERNALLQDMIRPALLSWSAALRVDPVVGNLTVDKHQLSSKDNNKCGPYGVSVPEDHITIGVPDTDMILYIHLAFAPVPESETPSMSPSLVDGNNENDDADDDDGFSSSTIIEDESSSSTQEPEVDASGVTTQQHAPDDDASSGKGNDDEEQTQEPLPEENYDADDPSYSPTVAATTAPAVAPKVECAGDYLAAASFCSTDQFDRPTAATLQICIGRDFFDPVSLQKNILVVQHELGHALGFNAISLAHFRRPDGSPITKRNRRGEIPLTEIECTGPHDEQQRRANVTLPSDEILDFRTVRGVRVAQVITPSVAQVARNHFDCQELSGAELESGEFLPRSVNQEASCLGDHWERRLFKSDLMNPIIETVNFNPRISTITLAYFADSGWCKFHVVFIYMRGKLLSGEVCGNKIVPHSTLTLSFLIFTDQVDLARAAAAATWGRGAGCAFVEETCIDENGEVPPKFAPFFCNDAPRLDLDFSDDIHGCTQDLTRKAICTMGQYDESLPSEYQYFPSTLGANIGGSDPFMDYCPVYAGYSNGLCSDPENDAVIRVDNLERFGRRNSRCLKGKMKYDQKTAFCLPIACVVEDRTLRIQIAGVWQICSKKDELLPLGNTGSFVTCPDPISTCPTLFCYRDCLGTSGRCDFAAGECFCNSTACVPVQESEDVSRQQFFDSTPKQSSSSIPEPDSPLADIYVRNERGLSEERRPPLFDSWEFPLGLGTFTVVIGVILYFRFRKRSDSATIDPGPGTDDSPDNVAVAPSANKDKMIATVVVDMRMNDLNLQEDVDPLREQRASETDLSMTDTEGAASHVSNLSMAGEEEHLPTQEEPEEMDSKPRAIIRRRRVSRFC